MTWWSAPRLIWGALLVRSLPMTKNRNASLVWFRSDLRLSDNPALNAAVERGGPVIPAFIWTPEEEGNWPPGSASRWWLHQSLAALDGDLRKRGSRLILRAGRSLAALRQLISEAGATAVFYNRRYEPAVRVRDGLVQTELANDKVHVQSYNAGSLFEPPTVHNKQGGPFQVFTAYWRACLELGEPPAPAPEPLRMTAPARWPKSMDSKDLGIEPKTDWAAGIRETWRPGEAGAAAQLKQFLEHALVDYATGRNRPDYVGTSRLSPSLHFGEISPRQVWQAIRQRQYDDQSGRLADSCTVFRSEVGWREFGTQLLFHFPHTADEPLRERFARFPWNDCGEHLRAWQRGRTGYPIVDAGMRELWHTGWMHNRVRMIVASFLVKHLLIRWQYGAEWFWDTLVDADLANNALGWQWSAGCGADAAPYFRIFNPVTQGKKFDPAGIYVRRWAPELAKLPDRWIHEPWAASEATLRAANIELGATYPQPIVEHATARKRALEAVASIRSS